jgi:hypothetical protein
MAFISPYIFDFGLSVLSSQATRLDLCTNEPDTFQDAVGKFSVGNKGGIEVSPPISLFPSGRKVTISKIEDGHITRSGTAAFWAVSDPIGEQLLSTGPLADTEYVTNGNLFTLSDFDIGIP